VQLPPAQVSLVVQSLVLQSLLSLQGAVLLVCVQPEAGFQVSPVEALAISAGISRDTKPRTSRAVRLGVARGGSALT